MTLHQRLALAAMSVVDFVASLLDRGIDGAIAALSKAEADLAAYATRLDARLRRELDNQSASYDRERAFRDREVSYRTASRDRTSDLVKAQERAARIRSRISALLD